MRSLTTLSDLYQTFVTQRDHVLACETSRELLHAAFKDVPDNAYEQKIEKLLDLARHEPQRPFHAFLAELAAAPEAVSPEAPEDTPPSPTLFNESAEQSIARLWDLQGRTIDRLVTQLAATGEYEPAVLLRTRHRLADVLNGPRFHASAAVQALIERLREEHGMGMRALWQCVDLLDCSRACLDLGMIQVELEARIQKFLQAREKGQTLQPAEARRAKDYEAARLMLLLISLQDPDSMPSMEQIPGLAHDLTLFLQKMVPHVYREAERLDRARLVQDITLEHLKGSHELLDSLAWPAELKQAARALGIVIDQIQSWCEALREDAQKLVRDEAVGRANRKVSKDPAAAAPRLARAALLVRVGRDTEALQDVRQALAAEPSVEGHRLAAVALANLGDLKGAEASATAAEVFGMKEAPLDRGALILNFQLRAELRHRAHRPWEALADIARADMLAQGLVCLPLMASVDQAETQLWDAALARLETDGCYRGFQGVSRGRDYFKARRFADAAAAFTAALALNDAAPWARMGRDIALDLADFSERVMAAPAAAGDAPEALANIPEEDLLGL